MGLLSRLWKKIRALLKAIVKKVARVVKRYWWVILAVLVVWFAPAISAWLVSVNAPTFLVTAVNSLVPASQWLHGAVSSMASFGAKALKAVGLDWEVMGFGSKAALVAGASFLIAPDETAAIFEEVGKSASKAVGDGLSRAARAFGFSPWMLYVIGGFVAYRVLSNLKRDGGSDGTAA